MFLDYVSSCFCMVFSLLIYIDDIAILTILTGQPCPIMPISVDDVPMFFGRTGDGRIEGKKNMIFPLTQWFPLTKTMGFPIDSHWLKRSPWGINGKSHGFLSSSPYGKTPKRGPLVASSQTVGPRWSRAMKPTLGPSLRRSKRWFLGVEMATVPEVEGMLVGGLEDFFIYWE